MTLDFDQSEYAMTTTGFLENKLLLAMPTMGDQRFERSVIYMCSHDASGAMGLVVNQVIAHLSFEDLLEQLEIDVGTEALDIPVHAGGPVEPGRGFVLHSADFVQDSTMIVSQTLALTATVDILKALADNTGPSRFVLALGYAGWGAGQLEREVQSNGWMIAEADDEILFNTEPDLMWPRAMAMLGIDIAMLSTEAGHS